MLTGISGSRTERFDRVEGLLIGADDYVVKPFLADELMPVSNGYSRVRASAPKQPTTDAWPQE
jgi:DNA-binding response OmpR family regulator